MATKLNCILLVDDVEFTNIYNRRFLEKEKVAEHIYSVKNGVEALDYLTHQGKFTHNGTTYPLPDLILLDINMPVMDGWEFLEEFKALTNEVNLKQCKVVVLTTSPNPEDENKARSMMEVTDYWVKPITREMINRVIIS